MPRAWEGLSANICRERRSAKSFAESSNGGALGKAVTPSGQVTAMGPRQCFAESAAYGKGPFCRRAFFAERGSRQNGPLRRELLIAKMQAHGNPVTCRRPVFAESRARQTFSLSRARVFALGKNLGSRQRTFSGENTCSILIDGRINTNIGLLL